MQVYVFISLASINGTFIFAVNVIVIRDLIALNINVCTSDMTSLTAHNWQNWNKVFLSCYCHEICRVEAVGLKKNYNCTWKIMISVNMWNLEQFLENQYFANNFFKVWISELFFTHVTHIVNIFTVPFIILQHSCNAGSMLEVPMNYERDCRQILFLSNWCLLKNKFPFLILHFLEQNQLALLKVWFLKKMLSKRANTCRFCFTNL